MFYDCQTLKELNPSNFNTDNVNDMSCMFHLCYSLKELDISNFNLEKNIKDGMFGGCSKELKNKIKAKDTELFNYIDYLFYQILNLIKFI